MIDKNDLIKKEQGKRLKESREYLRLKQAEFGAKIGLKWSQIKDRESGLVKIKLSEANNIENNFGINSEWIMSGQGLMTKGVVSEMSGLYQRNPHHPKPLLELTAHVLNTESVYRSALQSNVLAFYDAISAKEKLAAAEAKLAECQREIIELKQRLNEKNNIIEEYKTTISELRSTKSATNGV